MYALVNFHDDKKNFYKRAIADIKFNKDDEQCLQVEEIKNIDLKRTYFAKWTCEETCTEYHNHFDYYPCFIIHVAETKEELSKLSETSGRKKIPTFKSDLGAESPKNKSVKAKLVKKNLGKKRKGVQNTRSQSVLSSLKESNVQQYQDTAPSTSKKKKPRIKSNVPLKEPILTIDNLETDDFEFVTCESTSTLNYFQNENTCSSLNKSDTPDMSTCNATAPHTGSNVTEHVHGNTTPSSACNATAPDAESNFTENILHNTSPSKETRILNANNEIDQIVEKRNTVQKLDANLQNNLDNDNDDDDDGHALNQKDDSDDNDEDEDEHEHVINKKHDVAQYRNKGEVLKLISQSLAYYADGGAGAAEAQKRYQSQTVNGEHKIYLGEGISISGLTWFSIQKEPPTLFLRTMINNIWTRRDLANRALNVQKVTSPIPNRSPTKSIEPQFLRLIISIYHDYLERQKHIPVVEKTSILRDTTNILSKAIRDARKKEKDCLKKAKKRIRL